MHPGKQLNPALEELFGKQWGLDPISTVGRAMAVGWGLEQAL
jgi:hypothetical protein